MAAIKDPLIESQARQEWLKGFVENGINSDAQINAGLAKCRAHDSPFLPSIGQFIAWCREASPAMVSMPSEAQARMALIRELGKSADIRAWHSYHPAIYWVYGQHESFYWKSMTTKQLDIAFHEHWSLAMSMAKHGHVFDKYIPPSSQIGEIDLPPAQVEVALRNTGELLDLFSTPEEKREPTEIDILDLERAQRLKNVYENR